MVVIIIDRISRHTQTVKIILFGGDKIALVRQVVGNQMCFYSCSEQPRLKGGVKAGNNTFSEGLCWKAFIVLHSVELNFPHLG